MRSLHLLIPALLILAVAFSCTPASEQEDPIPDFGNLITGSYTYTTYKGTSNTGSGKAIITKDGSNTIRIGLADGVSFYANKLQKIDDDLVMDVPGQNVDYYGMKARFSGINNISRENAQYHGVYFGSKGELRVGLQITVDNKNDQVLLVLKR